MDYLKELILSISVVVVIAIAVLGLSYCDVRTIEHKITQSSHSIAQSQIYLEKGCYRIPIAGSPGTHWVCDEVLTK